MKLLWKKFLVLLAFSLIPLLAVTTIGQHVAKRMGKDFSEEARVTLTRTMSQELVRDAQQYASILNLTKSSLEYALDLLVRETEQVMAERPGPAVKVYFASDFDRPGSTPPDLKPNPVYKKITSDGWEVPTPVSFEQPVYHLAPGVTPAQAAEDLRRLSKLTPALKNMTNKVFGSIHWTYVSLASGVHMSYPGHGGYPENYDGRRRPWYRWAVRFTGVNWSPLLEDVTSRQLMFTASKRILAPNGNMIGVAGLDVLLSRVLLENEISSAWSRKMHSFWVEEVEDPATQDKALLFMGQRGATMHTLEDSGPSQERVVLFERLKDRFSRSDAGYLELPFEGKPSIWAFARIGPTSHLVIIVPKSVVMTIPNKASRNFLEYIQEERTVLSAIMLLVVLAVAVSAFTSARLSTREVKSLVDVFRRLARGDFSVRVKFRTHDERDTMYQAINDLIPKLEEHVRLRKALDLAQEVQQNLLPRTMPRVPGFDIAGESVYCDETGGDYYDFIAEEDASFRKFALVVGDVSGHGVSSALLMATARASLRLRAAMPGEAAAIISDINRHVSRDTSQTGHFMTLFYAEFSSSGQTVRWVRAGHDPALVYEAATGVFEELKGEGLALGLDENYQYGEFERNIHPGQIIVIGTDGIWETRNDAGDRFGKDKVKELIRAHAADKAHEIMAAITEALDRFRGGRASEDDVTMVVIKVLEETKTNPAGANG